MIVITESRQKLRAWYRAIDLMGFRPKGLVTEGFAFAYPGDLDLLGFRLGETGVQEFGRLAQGRFAKRFQGTLETLPADTTILIATDNDQEGDVVAFDAAQMIQARAPSLLSRTVRVHAASMDSNDLRTAAEAAIAQAGRAPAEARGLFARMQRAAAPGRARAVLDRWIGGAYSYDAGAPCGRVKAAALGAVRLWSERPEALRAIPEIGEIRLRVAADDGGAAFTARIPLHGPVPSDLESLLAWHHSAEVPGRVVTARSAGAAVAPRDGRTALLNTGDALIVAARDYGLDVMTAMKGLEFSHHQGCVSYPRTAERHVSEAVARQMAGFAQKCGVPGLPDSPQEWSAPALGDGAHDALHPTRGLSVSDVEDHFTAEQRPRRRSASIMAGIVSERCFEAMRRNPLSWGSYRPDPDADLTETEIATLEELVWTRSEAEPLQEAEPPGTELRWWPLDSIMVELMMSEEIGRPSTWASHGHALKVSGWLEPGRDGSPPTLSPRGRDILSRLPPEAADPETSRHIQRILKDVPCGPDGTLDAPLPQVIAERIDAARAAFEGMDARLRAEMRRDDARLARTHRCRDEAQARPQDKTLAAAVQIADAAAALGLCGMQDDGGAPSDATGAEEHGSVEAARASADGATTLEPHIAQSRRSSAALLETLRRSNLARREATAAEAANRAAQSPDGANSKSAQRGDAADMPGPAPLALDPGPLTAPDGATAAADPHAAAPEGWPAESPGDAGAEAPDGWAGNAAQASNDAPDNSPDPAAQEGWPAESPDGASIEAPDDWSDAVVRGADGIQGDSPDNAAQEGWFAESPDDTSQTMQRRRDGSPNRRTIRHRMAGPLNHVTTRPSKRRTIGRVTRRRLRSALWTILRIRRRRRVGLPNCLTARPSKCRTTRRTIGQTTGRTPWRRPELRPETIIRMRQRQRFTERRTNSPRRRMSRPMRPNHPGSPTAIPTASTSRHLRKAISITWRNIRSKGRKSSKWRRRRPNAMSKSRKPSKWWRRLPNIGRDKRQTCLIRRRRRGEPTHRSRMRRARMGRKRTGGSRTTRRRRMAMLRSQSDTSFAIWRRSKAASSPSGCSRMAAAPW